jgi:predicted regulator of Ras-like GTPase activity (Roadblock/LC7/MglB family)
MREMDRVQDFINQLATLVGVQGAFIFDTQGAINQYSTPMKVSREQGVALASTLSRTLTGLSTVHASKHMDLDLVYEEGRLIVKGFASGGLCIICERQANYSLINITLEQGLGLLRSATPQPPVEQGAQVLDMLKDIAGEMLGDYASKVIPILESAGEDKGKLEGAIEQAENMTRMFISKSRAGEMAQRMRDVLKSES